jgi:Tfp pilus assembly protein PilX
MNTKQRLSRNESGSVLMIALVMAGLLGVAMLSYFLLMSHQNRMVFRGQSWNHALTLAEAGVEDGLAQLNRKFGTNNSRGGVNGWSGATWGPATLATPRALSGGTYTATISDGMPIITSTGRVVVANSSAIVERRVRVFCTTKSAFQVAVAAKKDITFNGDMKIDSYDSSDLNYSTPTGRYDPAKRKAGGDIASTEGFIKIGNADVKGKLYTGPLNEGDYLVGSGGSVGDLNWTGPGIQSGWYFNDFNMDFVEVDEPYTIGLPPSDGGTTTNVWLLGDGQYKHVGNFVSSSPDKTITVIGDATVYVTGTFDMKGAISIAPGGSLKLYVGGLTTKMNQVNTEGDAFSFQYYGLPSNESISWGGNAEYVGTIYAPQATLKMGGGGDDPFDFQGACVLEGMTLNGHFSFHFDENLRKKGPQSGFVVTRWDEE